MLIECLNAFHSKTILFFLQHLGLWLNLRVSFSSTDIFLSRKHSMQWINLAAFCEGKLDFQFLTYIGSSACPLAWFPYNLQELTSCVYFIHAPKLMQIEWVNYVDFCVNQNGHYFYMHRHADKRTQWPTLFRKWFCDSDTNHQEIFY